ncbi:cyclic nucleotide-binding domain-containing protein [Ornithinimicrobium cryptoxanthini]|uniref:Cyclic nucleotide-binding domain-containing protein n=1 Tax=Ornithinimicrobium cryptoxanthini TaxID=2934161 RepID=A0ABY4YHC2_9MICO|nr:cyclic nucleotide-binding domain-containing protein [Ornithinimicrobium cryptoxanthini]USQ76009.1 cyclic nucleotide-binding domain-containing protein [Ornithinimicrobium cryptoxanthini]
MSFLGTAIRNRNLARLETVWAAATLVRWALSILVALYAYDVGGAAAVGLAALARMVPAALLAPRLAMSADRHSRRAVLLASLVARLVLAAGLWALVAAESALGLVLVAAAAYGVAHSLQKPTQAALLTVHARNPAELAAANTLWSMLDNAAFLAGSLLVGALVMLSGVAAGFAACLVPLSLAIVVLVGLPPDRAPAPFEPTSPWDEAVAGVRVVWGSAELRLLTGVLMADIFVQGMVDVLIVITAIDLLDMGEQGAGWLSAAWGAGGIVGGVIAAVLIARKRVAAVVAGGLLLGGLPLITVAVWPEDGLALWLLACFGVGLGLLEVTLLTLTQRLIPADVMARVYGLQETLTISAMAVGSAVASGLVLALGQRGALIGAGLLLPVTAVLIVAHRKLLAAGPTASNADFELLRAVGPFATLPVATVENLAARADHQSVDPEDDVVRQGEQGDCFYVIKVGAVDILKNGRLDAQLGAGDFFGGIALLRDTVRNATVRATTPLDLLVLHREEFMAAVCHPRTRHGLDTVAAQRQQQRD